ncbi:MAG: clostripain-related cysteine peptidase [Thermoplasmatota archaeon]
MRRIGAIVAAVLLLLSGAVIGIGENAEKENDIILTDATLTEWTIMVFMDADNDLESQGIDDLMEMAEVGSDPNINIIVQMDRISWSDHYDYYIDQGFSISEAAEYADEVDDDRYGDWDTCKRFFVTKDMTPTSSNAVSDLGEVDMGDSLNLYNFISWSVSNYPAERYGLIIWDHGNQWKGICWDHTNDNDNLNMSELGLTFSKLYIDSEFHMDFIGFDAGLMASAEVAYQILPHADYMIASEMEMSTSGWIYNWSFSNLAADPLMTTEEFCRAVVDDYIGSCESIYSVYEEDATLSVLNLTSGAYSGLYSFHNFTTELFVNYSLYQNYINYAWGIREDYNVDYCDAMDLFSKITSGVNNSNLNGLYNALVRDINCVFCYQNISDGNGDGYPMRASGLSIYFPAFEDYDSQYTGDNNFRFAQDTFWPNLLWSVYNQTDNRPPAFSMVLPSEQNISVYETDHVELSVAANDTEGNHLRYYWFIQDRQIGEGSDLNLYTSLGENGSYNLSCMVVDGFMEGIMEGLTGYDTHDWNLTIIKDVDAPIIINVSSIQERIEPGTSVAFSAEVYDDFRLEDVWMTLALSTPVQKQENFTMDLSEGRYGVNLTFEDTSFGWHEFSINARDPGGNTVGTELLPFYVIDEYPPMAVAPPDIVQNQHTVVEFEGYGCSDNYMITNYTWTFNYRDEEVNLYGIFQEFIFDIVGVYDVALRVEDNDANSDKTNFKVTILDVDKPIADAGPDVVVDQHQTVMFDASGSYDNVGIQIWHWDFIYNGMSIGLSGQSTNFIFDIAGEYLVTLAVTDEACNFAEDQVIVTVRDTTSPTVNNFELITINQHETVNFDASGCTDNVGIVNFTWTFIYGMETIELFGIDPTFTFDDAGKFWVTLIATDQAGNTGSKIQEIIVNDITPPSATFSYKKIGDDPVKYSFDGSGSSDNVGIATYKWTIRSTGIEWGRMDVEVVYEFPSPGTYTIGLEVNDLAGNSDFTSVTITVEEPVIPDDDDDDVVDDDDDDDVVDDDDDVVDDDDVSPQGFSRSTIILIVASSILLVLAFGAVLLMMVRRNEKVNVDDEPIKTEE